MKKISLNAIDDIVATYAEKQYFALNVGIPLNGKDTYNPPIPFTQNMYLVKNPEDWGIRTPRGDEYDSEVTLYSLSPISASYLTDQITFGFINTNFTLILSSLLPNDTTPHDILRDEPNSPLLRFYRITAQRRVYNSYYVLKAKFSI